MTRAQASGLGVLCLLFAIYFGANGIFFPYINVYYQSLGLSGTQIGFIGTLGPLSSILGMTLFSMLNDRYGHTRLLLMLSIIGGLGMALCLSVASAFIWIVPVACLYSFLISPVIPLLDSTTLSILGERRAEYGKYRVWGTIGFIATTSVVGYVLEWIGLRQMFFLYALVMACMLLPAFRLPVRPVYLGGFSLQGLGEMLRQPPWLVFCGSIFLLGLSLTGIVNFLSMFLRAMGASQSLIGLSWTMAAASEIPIMLFSASLLRRLGAPNMIAIAFAMFAVRGLLYATMPTPTWAVAINFVFGAAFAIYWTGAVNYVSELASPAFRTTSQSLLTSTVSLANVVGALVSGWLYDHVGPARLFVILSVCAFLSLAVFVTGQRVSVRQKTRPAHLQ